MIELTTGLIVLLLIWAAVIAKKRNKQPYRYALRDERLEELYNRHQLTTEDKLEFLKSQGYTHIIANRKWLSKYSGKRRFTKAPK